jgi:hypothetical protein
MPDEDAVPPFALATLAFDPTLGWSGWGPGAGFIPVARGLAAGGGLDGAETDSTETREGR